MILVTERTALANAMTRVAGIVDSKQTIPILQNVHLSAADNLLTIRATNLDMEAVESIPAVISEPGETTVNATKLSELAKSLPQGAQVKFELKDRLGVSAGRSRFQLPILATNSFPLPWDEDWPTLFSVDGEALAKMIARVEFAQSRDKPFLQGVRIESRNGKLRLVATNSFVLSQCDGPEVTEFKAVTVPSRMIMEIAKMAGPLEIGISESKIMVQGEYAVTSKLVALAYPEYERIYPKSPDKLARVNVEAFSDAIRRASIAATNGKNVTVKVTFKKGSISVAAQNQEADAFDEIEAEYDGEEITLPLNPPGLLNILGSVSGEMIETRFNDKNGTMIWAGDGDGLAVIAPQLVS